MPYSVCSDEHRLYKAQAGRRLSPPKPGIKIVYHNDSAQRIYSANILLSCMTVGHSSRVVIDADFLSLVSLTTRVRTHPPALDFT
jgi:hypothetical protein